jgi:uncharacterized membrane protein YagU involved in acid resistance
LHGFTVHGVAQFEMLGVMTSNTLIESVKFKSAVVPTSIAMFLLMVGLFSADVALMYGLPINWTLLVPRLMYALVVAPILAWLLSTLYPYTVSSDGLYGYSIWGARRFIRWSDIGSVRVVWFLNLKYLRLRSEIDGNTTWVLTMFQDSDRFSDAVHRHEGPDNPITRYLK